MTTNQKNTSPEHRKRPRYYRDLTAKQQGLLRKFQQVGYGSVDNLYFEDGEPLARPAPKTRRNIRLKSYGNAKPPDPPDDFELKEEHVKFFELLEEEGSGYIANIKITDGLPAEVSMEDDE
jgi:hypothetical protein